jgi:hypothetical protein
MPSCETKNEDEMTGEAFFNAVDFLNAADFFNAAADFFNATDFGTSLGLEGTRTARAPLKPLRSTRSSAP